MRQKNDSPLSQEERRAVRSAILSRKIYCFYEFLSWLAPIIIMLWHWYGVFDYSRYPRPTILDTDDNGSCVIWMYVLCYAYMPFAMIPVSYFFQWCWIIRIPFYYFIGINAIRLWYHHWLITPEQLPAHYVLIVLTIIFYIYGIISFIIQGKKCPTNVREWRVWFRQHSA
mgnify:FL=1